MVRMNGFIVIDRKLLEWKYAQFPYAMALWIHILLKANWRDGWFMGVAIPRGSFATSMQNLADATGMEVHTVRKWLKRFESDGQIELKSTNRFTVIKVLNYSTYQDIPDEWYSKQDGKQDSEQSSKQDSNQRSNNLTKKQSNKETIDIYTAQSKLIIDYFNRKTGKALRYTEGNMKHIRARLREGFKVSDFEKVIDAKYREWHGSPKMAKYLRPETLFGTKFDSYLNESGEGSAAIRIDTPDWYKRVKEEGYQEQEASAELIEQFEQMKRSMKQ